MLFQKDVNPFYTELYELIREVINYRYIICIYN